jgi:hypothetical protein
MKLRVIIRDSTDYPYQVQVKKNKYTIFWKDISIHSTFEHAENAMRNYKPLPAPGTVMAIYTDEDRLVEKLKG